MPLLTSQVAARDGRTLYFSGVHKRSKGGLFSFLGKLTDKLENRSFHIKSFFFLPKNIGFFKFIYFLESHKSMFLFVLFLFSCFYCKTKAKLSVTYTG